ncbi:MULTISPECIES: sigma-70 family RNA polymerase sigma factor [Pseudomonas]|uniref:sigma-70 family RNA polymerase sigma factor n=1 Tax=Pseudomonas TaxID=286 RepID=UPI0020935E92|nr:MULTISPECIES: sigma-70 family RNA polymerase sigma factor [Pseudomonas]USS56323.1 sigma-70 family RNA polymerase sigma factor [Pseudomonas kermanshahensis]UVL67209.1 sigma-70 family RNA polymerase sigma factor [Pseudomonas sp. B21-031]
MADDKLQLYLAHRAALVDYARPIVGCRARAEDVVQEAWLRFSGQDDDADIRHPASYLYRIVRNLALDQTRRTATEKAQPDGDDILAELPSSSASPEQAVSQQNELDAISRALEELPQRTRIAFEMHRLGGFTLQQVANHLNVSVSLVHQLVRDAMSHCMARLEDDL